MSQKDADGMANSADPDQTAPRSSLIWVCTICPGLSVRKLRIITVHHINRHAKLQCCIVFFCLFFCCFFFQFFFFFSFCLQVVFSKKNKSKLRRYILIILIICEPCPGVWVTAHIVIYRDVRKYGLLFLFTQIINMSVVF